MRKRRDVEEEEWREEEIGEVEVKGDVVVREG